MTMSIRLPRRLQAALLAVALGAQTVDVQAGETAAPSLSGAIARAVRDSNGDGLADEIVARIVVPARPTVNEMSGAADIALRLGYETTAASLPVTMSDAGDLSSVALPILVGRQNRHVQRLIAEGALTWPQLEPGQGLVAFVDSPGQRPVVVVAGADDVGTRAAAVELAARLPRLWSATGVKLEAVEAQVRGYLKAQRIEARDVAVSAIVVDAERRGLASITLKVTTSPQEAKPAVTALASLDEDHRFGRRNDVLDFAPLALTRVEVRSVDGLAGTATVRRTGPNWRALTALPPPPPTPDSAALVRATSAPPSPARTPFRCVGCPAYKVDGLITGGGGGSYGPPGPIDPAPSKPFDLSEAYTINGWYADRYRDLIPDGLDTSLVLGGAADEMVGAAQIAARLGLETTGVTLPIAKRDDEIYQPANEKSPILVGRDNRLVRALVEARRIRLDDLAPGEGVIEVVPRAFGAATATVVAGADRAGAEAASAHLARRLPFIWDARAGDPTLADLKVEVADFFAARSFAGQAAQAVDTLSPILSRAVAAGPIERLGVKVYLDGQDKRLEAWLRQSIARQAPSRQLAVEVLDGRAQALVFSRPLQASWEGNAFWARFKGELLPQVKPGDDVAVRALLSEEPAVRARMAAQAVTLLKAAGAKDPRVDIGSAYKQGYFWLVEQVLPALKGKPVASLRIKVRAEQPDRTRGLQSYEHPARWIKVLYPADAVFQRDLGLPVDSFVIEQVDQQASVYSLEATDAEGAVIFNASFDPAVTDRAVLDLAPNRARALVETGRLAAVVNGRPVVQERIVTDLEQVWDRYQQEVLPRIADAMRQAAKAASADSPAPVFRDLRISGLLSEPDYEFGVEGEHISALEGLTQDLTTLTSSYLRATGAPSPARVIPLFTAKPGQAARIEVTLSQNAAPAPRIEVSYLSRDAREPVAVAKSLEPLAVDAPQVTRIVARTDGLGEIGLKLTSADDAVPAKAERLIDVLGQIQKAGALRSSLSYAHVDALAITVQAPGETRRMAARFSGEARASDVVAGKARPSGPLVAWDHVIDPAESEAIIASLASYPAVTAYRKARSYEGRDISALEITEPSAGALVSVAKLSAYKPTALIVGRQHGNEPSSTSFILRLAEKLASDPGYSDIVRKVNVVLLPVMNPDGATLAGEIRKLRPTDIAGAGYLSALGQDVTVSRTLPESVVDPYLWRRWLPDLYLNAHGAASHEVVQPFSGYVSAQAPTYGFRRGWYSLGFRVARDPRHGPWETAALALRQAMASGVSADPIARAGNLEDYARFERWGHRFAPHLEQREVVNDTMLFYSDPGSGETLGLRRLPAPPADTPQNNREAWIGDWPTLTLDAGVFEAADEGARGARLALAARDGFAAALSQLTYLRDGVYRLDRIDEEAPGDGATLTTLRLRPVMPPKTPQEP